MLGSGEGVGVVRGPKSSFWLLTSTAKNQALVRTASKSKAKGSKSGGFSPSAPCGREQGTVSTTDHANTHSQDYRHWCQACPPTGGWNVPKFMTLGVRLSVSE